MSRYPWPDFSTSSPMNLPDEDGWILIAQGDEDMPHTIRVKVDELPDGRPIITGLMLDPTKPDDFGGYLRDQEINTAMLSRFPTRSVLTAAISLDVIASEGNLLQGVRALIADLGVAAEDDGLDEVDATGTDRDRRIVEAVRAYSEAVRSGDPAPRQYAAEETGLSARTIDEYLSEARKRGWLKPYQGPQAKHGVTPDAATTGKGSGKAPRLNTKGSK